MPSPRPRPRLGLLVPGALAIALATSALPVGLLPSALPDADAVKVKKSARTITVKGAGYGHGHGMSQYGAKGAAQRGLGYRQILGHYYPGTGHGRATGRIKVRITADPGRTLIVRNRPGLVAKTVGKSGRIHLSKVKHRAARQADRWRIAPLARGRSALAYRNHGWHRFRTMRGTLQFAAKGAPITLVMGKKARQYRGSLRSVGRHTVNVVALDSYLKGVVPYEMPATWPTAAVRAQAVAARSYAAYERRYRSGASFHVYDTTASQVYGGRSAEHPASNRAVRATRHQIRTYGGRPAFTQFSSSNAGWMLAGAAPYLVSKRDQYDPVLRWRKKISVKALRSRWPSAGRIRAVRVHTYSNAGPWVRTVSIHGSRGTYRVSGDQFRTWAGLRSAAFHFST